MRIFVLILLLSVQVQSAPQTLMVKVQFGDSMSEYAVDSKRMTYSDSQGNSREKFISEKDYKFLVNEFKAMKSKSNEIEFCPRNHTQISLGKESRTACNEGKNKLSKQMDIFLQLLKTIL